MSDEQYWCPMCESIQIADGMHDCREVWCQECKAFTSRDHDCPYRGGVRLLTPVPKKTKWGWKDLIWLSLIAVSAIALTPWGRYLGVKFWAWMDGRN